MFQCISVSTSNLISANLQQFCKILLCTVLLKKKSVGFLLNTKNSKAQLTALLGKVVHIQNSSQVKTFYQNHNVTFLHFCQFAPQEEQTTPTIQG